jgi:hypothetical protein
VDEPLIDGPREPDAGEIEGAAWGDRAVRGVLEVTERSWPVVMVFVACAAILFWRALSWAPSERGDAWEYTAWGQALSRGERPVYGHAMTTPKPLGFAVGLLVSPMSPWRAFQVAIIVALAVLAAALFWGAFREAGAVGAVFVLGALGFSSLAGDSLRFGLIDAIVAALVMVALVTRGPARVVCLFVAGLARPEAWVLCGLAGYTETAGSRGRRLAAGLAAAAAAPLVWLLVDLGLTGDPLASLHRGRRIVSIEYPRFHAVPLSQMPSVIWSALDHNVGVVIILAGTVGVLLHMRRGLTQASFDPLPVAVLLVWAVMVTIETRGAPFEDRYIYAAAMPLLLGAAVVLGWRLPARWRGGRALATAGAIAAVLVTTIVMPGTAGSAINRNVAAAMPSIERALTCGQIRVVGRTGHHRAEAVDSVLSALTHRGINEFHARPTDPTLAAILVLGKRQHRPNDWTGPRFGSLTLALSPRCDLTSHA